jgi:hypothetical protein
MLTTKFINLLLFLHLFTLGLQVKMANLNKYSFCTENGTVLAQSIFDVPGRWIILVITRAILKLRFLW